MQSLFCGIKQKFLTIFIDVILIITSILFSFYLRLDFKMSETALHSIRQLSMYLPVITVVFLALFKQYSNLLKFTGIDELIKIVIANILSVLLFLLLNVLIIHLPIFRSFYIIYFLLSLFLISGSRISHRVFERLYCKFFKFGVAGKRVLIIGAGDAGAMTIKELQKNNYMQKIPVAVLDDDTTKHRKSIHGVPIVGLTRDIEKTVLDYNISEIIISMPSAKKSKIKEVIGHCKNTNCKIKTLPGVSQLIDGKVDIKRMRDVQIEDLLGRDSVHINMNNIKNFISNKTVLVTGGGGSIGSELCRQIATYGPAKLLILDIYENGAYDIQQELLRKYKAKLNLEIIIASVRDTERMRRIFENYKPQLLFHAAAHKHVPIMEKNPFEAVKNNIFGTLNCVNFANEFNLEKFVLVSTDKAVNPTNIMGATKRVCELVCQTTNKVSKTDFVAVRFGNVLGSNGSVIPLFKKQLEEGGPITVTHPDIIRYFMTIPEAVQLILQAGAFAQGGEIFVLDMGEPVKINELAKDFIKLSGFELGTDMEIVYSGLRPGEKLYEELLMAEEGLSNTIHQKIFIGKPTQLNPDLLFRQIEALKGITDIEDEILLESIIKVLVPTYLKQ